jgi:cytochrome P450
MKQYSQSVLNHTQKLLENWELNYSDDQQIEVTAEFHALALSIASEAFFGVQIGKAQMIADVLKVCGELASDRLRSIVKFPRWLPFPRHLRASQAIQKMDEVVNDLILTYRRHPTENNVLANLIGTRDPESQSLMEDQQLRDEIVTLLLASHDTTTCTLAWVVYCLGKNPEVEKRVYDEIYTTLGHCPPTYEDLEKIKYLKWVIQETLRLYPAFANLSREAISDDEIDGYSIQKGSMVNCSQYVTHRLEEFWSEPHKFDPERFCPERSIGRHPFAYYPFGRGARACVGEHFAMMEIQLILIQLLQKYQLCLVPEHAVIASPRITLFTKSGIKVVLKKRKN